MAKRVFKSIAEVKREFFPNATKFEKMKENYDDLIPKSAGKCPYCGKDMVRHIIKEGARYHVTSWHGSKYGALSHCSDPNCENNHGPGHCVPRNSAKSGGETCNDHDAQKDS